MTLFELKKNIVSRLTATGGEFSDFEAFCILRSLLGISREAFLLRSREEIRFDEKEMDGVIRRRIAGEPLAYILGETYFFGRRFAVTPDVLIPRTDTEFVVEKAIEVAGKIEKAADLCTGSGAIAVTLAAETGAEVFACDISPRALCVARENAKQNGTERLVSFSLSDVREDVFEPDQRFDLVISNPPYVKSAVVPTLDKQVKAEPTIALDGGEDGLDFYRAMLAYLPRHLTPKGKIVFEIGYDQKEEIGKLAKENGLSCSVFDDYGGNPRTAVLARPQ